MKLMAHFRSVVLALCMAGSTLAGCASMPAVAMAKVPDEVWKRLERGEPQDLIVTFNDSAIREQAARLNDSSEISRDEAIIRFKTAQYAALKETVLSALPYGEVEVLKDYEVLPVIFIRFRSTAALEALLAHPSVLRAYEDRRESPMPGNPGR